VALASGLVKRNSKGELYGFYRGRLIFPIWGEGRKVIGFGGRVIPSLFTADEAAQQAKYLNSPETSVYQKSKVLYGLDHALSAIRSNRSVFVVEGYLDTIAMNAGGLANVVATCGTALTKDHLRRLSRLTNKISLLFDGDNAGREAAAKCFPLFLNSGVDAKAIFLPEGEDPHSIYVKHGPAMAQIVRQAESKSLLDSFVLSALNKEGVRSISELGPAARSRVCEQVADLLVTVEKPVERSQLITQASFLLDISPEVRTSLFDPKRRKANETGAAPVPSVPAAPTSKATAAEIPAGNSPRLGFPPELRSQVSELERSVVRLVILNRSMFPARVLADPRLCSVLSETALQFVESVKQVVDQASLSDDEARSQVRDLIAQAGPEYIKLWKQTREIAKEKGLNLDKLFEECSGSAQRLCIARSLSEVSQAIKATDNPEEKVRLIKQQMELARMAKQGATG
jgi:DNA primase